MIAADVKTCVATSCAPLKPSAGGAGGGCGAIAPPDSATSCFGAGGIHGVADEGEDIRVVVQPVSAIESLLQSGRVDNAASLITLQWLLLNREALDREWRP